jgi:hypothetical protein
LRQVVPKELWRGAVEEAAVEDLVLPTGRARDPGPAPGSMGCGGPQGQRHRQACGGRGPGCGPHRRKGT